MILTIGLNDKKKKYVSDPISFSEIWIYFIFSQIFKKVLNFIIKRFNDCILAHLGDCLNTSIEQLNDILGTGKKRLKNTWKVMAKL